MKTLSLVAGGVIGLLAGAAPNSIASGVYPSLDTENVSFALTATIQGETTDILRGTGSNREKIGEKTHGPTKVKINNKSILKLLDAPAGSKLVLTEDNSIALQVGDHAPVETGYTLQFDTGTIVVLKGQDTEVDTSNQNHERLTVKSSYRAEYVGTAIVAPDAAVPGFLFSLTGPAVEEATKSEVRNDDLTKSGQRHSLVMSGAGEGTIPDEDSAGLDALVSGTIKTSGKVNE